MVGKSKDSKANKSRKALENEWEDAVSAAATGNTLIASAVNREGLAQKGRSDGGTGGVYVAQAGGGSAKDRYFILTLKNSISFWVFCFKFDSKLIHSLHLDSCFAIVHFMPSLYLD